jgi:hypothetical protein
MVAVAGRRTGGRRRGSTAALVAVAPVAAERDPHAAAALEVRAVEAGTRWADARCDELTRSGRDVVGGWPCTMSEARSHLLGDLQRHVTAPPLSSVEFAALTRMAYVAARTRWLSRANRDLDE